ncbi:hypothetical protein P7K49_031321 [Saguinus oedipus]|uniref:Uncharacterized protein n=1 Tax=Saguinus oedipus TaxID=9490 RepID=A0ABQ9TZ23_SAGOE|nr:hypothetical protein P7K49_031321 [Saguinus oedipus]
MERAASGFFSGTCSTVHWENRTDAEQSGQDLRQTPVGDLGLSPNDASLVKAWLSNGQAHTPPIKGEGAEPGQQNSTPDAELSKKSQKSENVYTLNRKKPFSS